MHLTADATFSFFWLSLQHHERLTNQSIPYLYQIIMHSVRLIVVDGQLRETPQHIQIFLVSTYFTS